MGSFLIWIFFFAFIADLKLVFSQDFANDGHMGPDHWGEEFGSCHGKYQSPLNIATYKYNITYFPSFRLIGFSKQPVDSTFSSNGHTPVITFKYKGETPYISGGPFYDASYEFVQLSFHWSPNSLEGSEDGILNKTYPVELHIVFTNKIFRNFDEAIHHNDGVAVLAFFFVVSDDVRRFNVEMGKLIEDIYKANFSSKVTNPPALKELLPFILNNFFTYIGSLITPPCSKDVIWIDFAEPVVISEDQLERLRQLMGSNGRSLEVDFRPVPPLNGPQIYYQLYDISKPAFNVMGSASSKFPAVFGIIVFDLLLCLF